MKVPAVISILWLSIMCCRTLIYFGCCTGNTRYCHLWESYVDKPEHCLLMELYCPMLAFLVKCFDKMEYTFQIVPKANVVIYKPKFLTCNCPYHIMYNHSTQPPVPISPCPCSGTLNTICCVSQIHIYRILKIVIPCKHLGLELYQNQLQSL
jgi:hypothetical protein